MDPDAYTVTTGSYVSGSLSDVYTRNGAYLLLAEANGLPGFEFDFEFYNVPSFARHVTYYGRYVGNVGHRVKLQQWNYTSYRISIHVLKPDSEMDRNRIDLVRILLMNLLSRSTQISPDKSVNFPCTIAAFELPLRVSSCRETHCYCESLVPTSLHLLSMSPIP